MELLKSGASDFRRGDPRLEDFQQAYLRQACDLKLQRACGMLAELKAPTP